MDARGGSNGSRFWSMSHSREFGSLPFMHTSNNTVALLLALLTGCYGASDVLERDGGHGDAPGRLDAPVYFLDVPRSDAPRSLADAPLGDGAGELWEGYVEAFAFREVPELLDHAAR